MVYKRIILDVELPDDYDESKIDKALENAIKNKKPKLIYVTPTFNNPTGYSWSNNYLWSTAGSADNYIWPYWHHVFTKGRIS